MAERWDELNADGISLSARDGAPLTTKQKDWLAFFACSVRGRNVAAWNALTTPQKIAATLAELDVWKTLRAWTDTNL